jgi:hypothetical protein
MLEAVHLNLCVTLSLSLPLPRTHISHQILVDVPLFLK